MSESFAVEFDALFLGSTHELTVGSAELAEASVYFDIEKATHITLFVAAMSESIGTSMLEGIDSHALFLGAAKTEAFGGFENGAAVFECMCSFFDAGHGS